MEYYVISPNVWNDGNFDELLNAMFEEHMVLMGWGTDNSKGVQFANMQKGDCVIVAQRKNYVWHYYFMGIVKSNDTFEYEGAQSRYLETFIDLQELNNDFLSSWTTAGSTQIPAIGKIKIDTNVEIIKLLNEIIRKELYMEQINEIKNLLLNTHNLILHGAPGTGKTHLAKDIAKAMGCTDEEIGFVQFHPSYDYTDFVEGLRPVHDENDNVVFERKDGVFKTFCKKAVKTESNQNSDKAFNKSWSKLVNYLNENDYIEVPLISNKRKILVELNEYGTGLTNRSYENNEYKKDSWISGKSKFFNKEQLSNIYRNLPGVPNGGHDNYRRAIVKYMKDNFELPEYIVETKSTENKKNYVFIIDEINRGELSKIFGELFYNIDPGYRGENGKIATQYQNLVEAGDLYADGFFIPSNVYIIGTMNDIDRSVESMDFAFRRRFTFKEITANDTAETIIDSADITDEEKSLAKEKMTSLNNAIWNITEKKGIEGLSSGYHIGGAYFLKLKELENDFDLLWKYHLEGLLREYLRGMENSETLLEELHKAYNLESEDNQ